MTVPASNPEPSRYPANRRVVARVFAMTDVGRTRDHNEDTYLVADLESGESLEFSAGYHEVTIDTHGMLFLVADGMGGAASGELASSMASTLVLEALGAIWTSSVPSAELFTESLRDSAIDANRRIHRHALENPEHRGMGTTLTIAGILADIIYIVQVGDSRAYLVRDGQARQLTKDQSLMQRLVEAGELTQEEAEVSDRRNIILQALGPESHVIVDITHQQLRKGDVLVLCSDGLSGLVRRDEIAAAAHGEHDVRVVCQRLVSLANERGGPDNITAVVVRFDGDALDHSGSNDHFGYNVFSLAGTLNDHVGANGTQQPHSVVQRDPATPFGRPGPSLQAVDGTNAVSEPSGPEIILPYSRIAKRKRVVRPIYAGLTVIALTALAWTVLKMLG